MSEPSIRTEKRTLAVDDGTELGIHVARPAGTPRGGLLVLQEIFGVNTHIRDVTERFAREGYLAVAPDLFHRGGAWFESGYADLAPCLARANALTQPQIRADLRASHAYLAADLGADAKVAAVGFCMGGRQAFVANGTLPLACAISYYGAGLPGLADLAPSQSGPVLMFWGGLDKHIDAAQRRAAADLLIAAHKPYVDVTFGAADHGFHCDARASYHPVAARQAWALTRAFLADHLG